MKRMTCERLRVLALSSPSLRRRTLSPERASAKMKAIRLMAAGLAAITAKAITGGSDVETGVTATGATSQANSYALKASITSFTAGGAGTGARLPADLNVGDSVIIANYTGAALLLYPPTGGNLNNAGVNTSLSLPDKGVIQVTCISPLVFS